MEQKNLSNLKQEIQLKAKNGIDFILAASIAWFGIFLIWKFTINTPYEKSVFTFIFSAILLPIAFGFSKLFTGAHLFPYAWFYDEIGYAVTAIIISVGSMLIALFVNPADIFYVPIFTASVLLILGIWIIIRNKRLRKKHLKGGIATKKM